MARVNHKLVKARLNEKRSKITDRQFFISRLLAGHFEDIAAAQTRRYNYNRRVHVNIVWKPKSEELAMTDNFAITINAGHRLVTSEKGRERRYQIVCGLFAHELGHVLYTDFLASQTYANYMQSYKWFPTPPMLKNSLYAANEKNIWNYAKDDEKNLAMLIRLTAHILNVLEDGYIENRMLVNFPGTLGYGLEDLREKHFTNMETVTQIKEHEDNGEIHIFQSILEIMLSYAKFGEIKYGEESLSDGRIQTVFELLPDIDTAIMTQNAKDRLSVVNTILVRCWEYAKDFIEFCKARNDDILSSGGSETGSETLSSILSGMSGGTEIAEGSSAPVSASPRENSGSATSSKREQTKQNIVAATSPQTDSENENNPSESGGGSEDETEEKSDDTSGAGADNSGNPDESTIDDVSPAGETVDLSGSKQSVSGEEKGRIPLTQTERVSAPVGGKTERNDDYKRERYDNAAKDIENILEKMAEKAACQELENERIRELNDVAQNISYGDIHSGVNMCVNRIDSVDSELVEQYSMIAQPLLQISKQLQKTLIHQLKDHRRGGKQTGLLMGRRLDARALCRNDGKVFYKNALPNEMPQLSVGLLLDESGSMSSEHRCTYARAAAIILHDFCQSLDIPVMIYGHSTGYNENGRCVNLFSYAEFDGYDNDDKYRLMDIGARGSNRDGAALRFVAEQLCKRSETVKILILVSDGQPADSGYGGTAAEEDLRGIKHEYQRKGILFVAAAIGDDKENIERIYGDSFLDITDLNQLPIKLTSLVKRHIRV